MADPVDADVKAILDTSLTTTTFITAAVLVVDHHLGDAGLAVALLFEIKRWYAAHLVAIRDPLVTEMKVGDTTAAYQRGKAGMGLESTQYGQQVLALDPTGRLARANSAKAATLAVD